jgi:pimeloyl-ACP methyl ester carboxylesterase
MLNSQSAVEAWTQKEALMDSSTATLDLGESQVTRGGDSVVDFLTPPRVLFPEFQLADLRARLSRTRWPAAQPGDDWCRGVPLAYLQRLGDHWRTSFDWRRHEARLNRFPQNTTTIDGQTIHFMHVRSPSEDALPLILTHGWPSSVLEFVEVLSPLTDPGDGAQATDAFHLVVPSLPGFPLSGANHEAGWDVRRTARAWAELMRRLGYSRYGAQGSDLGALVSRELGRIDPDRVVGVHLNAFPRAGNVDDPVDLALRPQTLAYGLADSPAGQLAWMVERFRDLAGASPELLEDATERDFLLANATLYWLTGTIGSAARVKTEMRDVSTALSPTPVGVALFPDERVDRLRLERGNRVVRWTQLERGGRFAALQAPDLFVDDVRAFFHAYRD